MCRTENFKVKRYEILELPILAKMVYLQQEGLECNTTKAKQGKTKMK